MTVVSDVPPLISLAAFGQLDLLRQLYGTMLIPAAAHREVLRPGEMRPGEDDLRGATWIVLEPVENAVLAEALRLELGAGEAEAIAFAVEQQADLLLMDECRGRAAAAWLGMNVVGVLGAVVEAKHKGLISHVAPVIDRLRESGFRAGSKLYQHVLWAAGE